MKKHNAQEQEAPGKQKEYIPGILVGNLFTEEGDPIERIQQEEELAAEVEIITGPTLFDS